MTTPDTNGHGHGHGHEAPPFMPDAHFAVQAQQEEIERLRKVENHLNDRIIYLRAVAMQAQAEGQHQVSLARGEIENLRMDLAQRDVQIERLRGTQGPLSPLGKNDVEVELDQTVSGWQPEDPSEFPDDDAEPEGGVRVEQPDHEKIMSGAKFGNTDGMPPVVPGIEPDEEFSEENLSRSTQNWG
jgi:hypothetical protein